MSDQEKNLLDDEKVVKRKSTKTNHALIERFNRIKTPTTIMTPSRDDRLEKEIESLKEIMEKHEESLKSLEERMTKKEKVDESCCIGYCTLI